MKRTAHKNTHTHTSTLLLLLREEISLTFIEHVPPKEFLACALSLQNTDKHFHGRRVKQTGREKKTRICQHFCARQIKHTQAQHTHFCAQTSDFSLTLGLYTCVHSPVYISTVAGGNKSPKFKIVLWVQQVTPGVDSSRTVSQTAITTERVREREDIYLNACCSLA